MNDNPREHDANRPAQSAGQPATPAERGERVIYSEWYDDGAARKRGKLIIAASVLIIVVLALALWLLLRARKTAAADEEEASPVVTVKTAKVETGDIAEQVTALGTVFPREQATVSAKVSAQIKKMALLKNRVVRAGEVIAVLESRDLQAQRGEAAAALGEARANARSVETGTIPQTNAQDQKALRDARANVANARATYERRNVLYSQGGISKKDLEASQLALTTAENDLRLAEQTVALRASSLNPNDRALAAARVTQAEQHLGTVDAQLAYATIRSPLTGIVTDQFQFEGEFAAAGAKLVNVADVSGVIVKAPFPDTVAQRLKVGDAASVMPADIAGDQMNGKVTLVSRATDPANRTVEVWVTLANGAGRLRANDAAQVTVTAESKSDALIVPAAAVTLESPTGDAGTVMVVDDQSVAHERKVTVGIRTKDKIEITDGLKEGEVVVTEGNYALPDGTKVQEENSSESEGGAGEGESGGAGDASGSKASGNSNSGSSGANENASNSTGTKPESGAENTNSSSRTPAQNQPAGGGGGGRSAGGANGQSGSNSSTNGGGANSSQTGRQAPGSGGSGGTGAAKPGNPGTSAPQVTNPVRGTGTTAPQAPGGAKP